MVSIGELLIPGEVVLKKQSGVGLGIGVWSRTGDLFLTDKRILFLQTFGENIIIDLQNVRLVHKGSTGSIVIQADKEHIFAVTIFQNGAWVDEINTAIYSLQRFPQQPSPPFQTSPQQQTPPIPLPPPQQANPLRCPSCGRPADFIHQYNRWYCHLCQRYI
jgi:hypothetical protein